MSDQNIDKETNEEVPDEQPTPTPEDNEAGNSGDNNQPTEDHDVEAADISAWLKEFMQKMSTSGDESERSVDPAEFCTCRSVRTAAGTSRNPKRPALGKRKRDYQSSASSDESQHERRNKKKKPAKGNRKTKKDNKGSRK